MSSAMCWISTVRSGAYRGRVPGKANSRFIERESTCYLRAMQRLELGGAKFWLVDVKESILIQLWGKIGNEPETRSQTFANPEAAVAAAYEQYRRDIEGRWRK